LKLQWTNNDYIATLEANLSDFSFKITGIDEKGDVVYQQG